MAYGFRVTNDAGFLIADNELTQMRFIASGSAAATSTVTSITNPGSTGATRTVSFPLCSYPLVFIRTRATEQYVYCTFISTNSFTFRSTGLIDYRVYDAGTYPASTAFGLQLRNAAGSVIYNTQYAVPFIKSIQNALEDAGEASEVQPTTPQFLRNLSHDVTAYDGGLPYVSAFSFTPVNTMQGTGWTSYCCSTAYFENSTTIGVYSCTAFKSGTGFPAYELAPTGQWPRRILITR